MSLEPDEKYLSKEEIEEKKTDDIINLYQ